MTFDLVIRAQRAITPAGERPCLIGIKDGRITAVEQAGARLDAARQLQLRADEVLLPGLIDIHVHVNEPGRTEWEGFATATAAAAAGGITTIIDMPLNSIPPTCDVGSFEVKRKTADGRCHVDVGFWGGAIPENLGTLRGLHEAGVVGFKCFLVDSGVPEFPPLDDMQLRAALEEIAAFDGLLIVHAESSTFIKDPPNGIDYNSFLHSRPPAAEDQAISRVVELSARTGCRVHVLHLASASALPILAAARADGVSVTAETCPHYLTFAAEEIPDGGTEFKCCPPIRDSANREALWRGLVDGDIDFIASDHSPCTADLKAGDFSEAWGGIASIQLSVSAVWTQARRRGLLLADVVKWMAERPAGAAGLANKGKLALGSDADFCVFAPDESFVVDPHQLKHRNPVTPYAGRELVGVVRSTWLRGRKVSDEPAGELLLRGRHD